MCNDHSGVQIYIPTATATFDDGTPRPNGKNRGVDACIAPLVNALNTAGFGTRASCCGHGDSLGNIVLTDGRELLIVPDYETARTIEGR